MKFNDEYLKHSFEVWCNKRALSIEKYEGWGDITYKHEHVESMWTGFKAHAQIMAESMGIVFERMQ